MSEPVGLYGVLYCILFTMPDSTHQLNTPLCAKHYVLNHTAVKAQALKDFLLTLKSSSRDKRYTP